ncbi:complex I subunit 5 family protein [Pirellulaceae bacterium SH449]
MMEWLLVMTLLTPLILAALQGFGEQMVGRRGVTWIAHLSSWAAFPGLLLAMQNIDFAVEIPWLFLGVRWGVDSTGRVFLGLTALLWFIAGIYARPFLAKVPRRRQFQAFFLLTMAGNLGVCISQDMISFLTFFTLMSLAAYGLIIHDRERSSIFAGKVYIIMTLFGEMALLVAIVLLAHQSNSWQFDDLRIHWPESSNQNWICGLLLVGFGIKMGIVPLHGWLPLAHPAAPIPASAVLSGAMIKTGLLGLMRMLPLGETVLPFWGQLYMSLGVFTCFYGACVGMLAINPKTVLAYSSVSQMGLMLMIMSIAMVTPAAWPFVFSSLLIWSAHHGIAKASLFLGVGVANAGMPNKANRYVYFVILTVAGLALAGLPMTLGYTAKAEVKYAISIMETGSSFLTWVLVLSSLTTTALVLRFLWIMRDKCATNAYRLPLGVFVPWFLLSTFVVVGFFIQKWMGASHSSWNSLSLSSLWGATWPILTAALLGALIIWFLPTRNLISKLSIPAGDVYHAFVYYHRWLWNRTMYKWSFTCQPREDSVSKKNWSRMTSMLSKRLNDVAEFFENDTIAALAITGLVAVLLVLSLT